MIASQDSGTCSNTDDQSIEGVEFLSFALGSEEYGIAIHSVQELRNYEAVTHIQHARFH